MLLHHMLSYWSDQSPNKTALIQEERKQSYRELENRSVRLAFALKEELGICQGDRVGVLSSNCIEMVELLFAISRVGAIMVPLNIRLTAKELQFIAGDAAVKTLFFKDEQASLAADLAALVEIPHMVQFFGIPDHNIIAYESLVRKADKLSLTEPSDLTEDSALMFIYTSGTTGNPKGAILSHGNNLWNCVLGAQLMEIGQYDVSITVLPLFHIGGWGLFLLPTLFQGGTVLIISGFDVSRVFKDCNEHKVTVFMGVPTILNEIRLSPEFKSTRLPTVRLFCSGGAPCPVSLIEAYHENGYELTQGFGMSETSPIALLMRVEDSREKKGSAGKPGICCRARIVDEKMNDLPPNGIGELVMQGNVVCQGYWNRSKATEEAFMGGWFHSGDLGYKDEDGFFYIVDRKKDMLISGGENVYPAEIESVLYQHLAIAEVSVFGIPSEKWGESPMAVIVLKQGSSLTEDELKIWIQDKLARYKQPKIIRFVDGLPKTASGKILKRELKLKYAEGSHEN
ncbi:long-chain fatty acid--CoA ligase [bacterium]|nr:long-chain fatty acid--CoA ligase [bacterium]